MGQVKALRELSAGIPYEGLGVLLAEPFSIEVEDMDAIHQGRMAYDGEIRRRAELSGVLERNKRLIRGALFGAHTHPYTDRVLLSFLYHGTSDELKAELKNLTTKASLFSKLNLSGRIENYPGYSFTKEEAQLIWPEIDQSVVEQFNTSLDTIRKHPSNKIFVETISQSLEEIRIRYLQHRNPLLSDKEKDEVLQTSHYLCGSPQHIPHYFSPQ